LYFFAAFSPFFTVSLSIFGDSIKDMVAKYAYLSLDCLYQVLLNEGLDTKVEKRKKRKETGNFLLLFLFSHYFIQLLHMRNC
jgi:hypothetical protein